MRFVMERRNASFCGLYYGKEKMSLEYIKEKCDEELIHKNPMPRVGFISDAGIS